MCYGVCREDPGVQGGPRCEETGDAGLSNRRALMGNVETTAIVYKKHAT